MSSYYAELLSRQERIFKSFIMRDYTSFNREYQDRTGFPGLETSSKEYELQKFFEVRLEHYIRTTLVNDVLTFWLKDKGVGIYKPESADVQQLNGKYYTNKEFEKEVGYEFVADFGDVTIMYRYTDIEPEAADRLLTDFVDKVVILDWRNFAKSVNEGIVTLSNGKTIQHGSLRDLFQERIGIEEYQDFISFLTRNVIDFQEYIGVKSVPKLSPYSLGIFRFEVENEFKLYIQKVRDYMKADEKLSMSEIADMQGIDYGYRVIDAENKDEYGKTEKNTKILLRDSDILESFEMKKLYRYFIGDSDFAKSFITSEYLYKQYDCDDCFDYTAIVSGYLKSIEQLLYHIVNFSKNKGYKIKSNGHKHKNGVYPPAKKVGKVYLIDFIEENDGCFDTTIGSLIHFLEKYKRNLICIDDYKKTIIDCLNCYRIECRNDSFHLDNNYKWSRVEFIRWNTFLLYILLLTCCKLGDTESQTKKDLRLINDDRLERLYSIIATGKDSAFEFVFTGDDMKQCNIQVKHIAEESSYPSYNNIGQIKSVFLTFETIKDKKKVFIMRKNVPDEIYVIDESGERTRIE